MNVILLRYGEIGLKKGLRKKFEDVLLSNLKRVMSRERIEGRIKREWGRIFVLCEEGQVYKWSRRLSFVFGIVSASPCLVCSSNIDDIAKTVLSFKFKAKSFALRVRRTGNHDYTSMDVARIVGKAVKDKTGLNVDLTNPDVEIFIEIREDKAYIFDRVFKGFGGLPVGTQGRVLALDEESAWFALRRGCDVDVTFPSNRILRWACYREINEVDFNLESAIESDYPAVFCSLKLEDLDFNILRRRKMPVMLPFVSERVYSVEKIREILKILESLENC